MKVIIAANAEDAWSQGIRNAIRVYDMKSIAPRDEKETMECASPVTTVYINPRKFVVFDPDREANPFFHFMEGLWMLAGRDDAEWISQYSGEIAQFAEDDGRFYGAYGYRWRHAFEIDQLKELILLLRNEPNTRRAVLTMWMPQADLHKVAVGLGKKDHPCSTHAYLKLRDGELSMTVCCRSNDIVWGCYGSNVVHFSMLLIYLADMLGVEVGTYTQISDSWHVYVDNPVWQNKLALNKRNRLERLTVHNPYYDLRDCEPWNMVDDSSTFHHELDQFMEGKLEDTDSVFNSVFYDIAVPMRDSYAAFRRGDRTEAIHYATKIAPADLQRAALLWLKRRAWK